ncbi:MAG: glycine betaine ABC transporter substrate-binding protein [Bacillaceae bacterium]|nr:glycine betaine ABC transporter substrate-binding protein [Bacillaceae bacterium]
MTVGLLAGCGAAQDNAGEGNGQQEQNQGNEGQEEGTEEKGTIKIGLNNWAENVAVSNMWKILLEEQGYTVELKSMEKAPLYLGIKNGDLDIGPEVWLPHTDKPFYEKYKDDIDWREVWYEGTGLGLVVPEYVDINSIEELNANKDQFEVNGEPSIVGIDPGASLMRMTRDAIEQYGLEYNLIEGSGPAMMSQLKKAYDKQQPIVVTLWNPHWAFADFDLKYLEDPKNIYGDAENIRYIARKGLAEDHPEVVKWFDNWKMDDSSLGSLMSTINEVGDPAEGAKQWIEENRDLVNEWIK